MNNTFVKYHCGYGLKHRPRSGRPRKIFKKVNRIIKRKSIPDVKKTATEIARELKDENLANVRIYGTMAVCLYWLSMCCL